jgi:hypothetical protein
MLAGGRTLQRMASALPALARMLRLLQAIFAPTLLDERHLLLAGGVIIGILDDEQVGVQPVRHAWMMVCGHALRCGHPAP